MDAAQVESLLLSFRKFSDTLIATTIPLDNGGRIVDGFMHALTLSRATNDLFDKLREASDRLIQAHGVEVKEFPAGFSLVESDSENGPWNEIPASAIRGFVVPIGPRGADPTVLAAFESIYRVSAFPVERWNALQKASPGGDHQRWLAGELFTEEFLERLRGATRLLRLILKELAPVPIPPTVNQLLMHITSTAAPALSTEEQKLLRSHLETVPTINPADRGMDLLDDLARCSGKLSDACEDLTAGRRDGSIPSAVLDAYTPPADLGEDFDQNYLDSPQAESRAQRVSGPHARANGRIDALVLATTRWRATLDRLHKTIPELAVWLDDLGVNTDRRWSYRIGRLLGGMGALVPKYDSDFPRDPGELPQRLVDPVSRIVTEINDLRARRIGVAADVDAAGRRIASIGEREMPTPPEADAPTMSQSSAGPPHARSVRTMKAVEPPSETGGPTPILPHEHGGGQEQRGRRAPLAIGANGPKGPPNDATRKVSLRHAAEHWFDMEDETLQNAIGNGVWRCTRTGRRHFVFDVDEVVGVGKARVEDVRADPRKDE